MHPRDRIVTHLPLEELWNEEGVVPATRGRRLGREDIRRLLAGGWVQFVIANGGDPLRWIPLAERFNFWKSEVAPHLAETESFYLDDFPDGLAYVASEWAGAGDAVIILLEASH
jgi:hypothetical protein